MRNLLISQCLNTNHFGRSVSAAVSLTLFLIISLFFFPQKSYSSSCSTHFTEGPQQNILANLSQETADELRLRILKSSKTISQFSIPGDRLVLRLSTKVGDIERELLSPLGLQLLNELEETITLEQIYEKISTEFQIPMDRAAELILDNRGSWLKNMVSATNQKNWSEVVRIYDEELNERWRRLPDSGLKVAFALNRRNNDGDRIRAIQIATEVIDNLNSRRGKKGLLSEAYGILARIYKDMGEIDYAIDLYLTGFRSNPFDYYPGIAGINLLIKKGTLDSIQRAEEITPFVLNAVRKTFGRLKDRGEDPDYWALVTELELLIILGNWQEAQDSLNQVIKAAEAPWMLETSRQAMEGNLATWKTTGKDDSFLENLRNIIQLFIRAEQQPQNLSPFDHLGDSYSTPQDIPNAEGIFGTGKIDLSEEIYLSEVDDSLRAQSENHELNINSFHKFLQSNQPDSFNSDEAPIILAPTGPYRDVIAAISEQTGCTPWWEAYSQLGIELDPSNVEEFISEIIKQNRKIIFLVPRQFGGTRHLDSYTYDEFQVVMQNIDQLSEQVDFIFGFEEVFPLDYERRITEDFVRENYEASIMRYFLSKFQEWLINIGPEVKH